MKTIQLTPQQRKDISDRRRNAPDRRVFQRLSAVLWSDDGRTREEIAELVGVSARQVGQWLRIFRNKGLEGCDLGLMYYEPPNSRHRPTFGLRSDCKLCLYFTRYRLMKPDIQRLGDGGAAYRRSVDSRIS